MSKGDALAWALMGAALLFSGLLLWAEWRRPREDSNEEDSDNDQDAI